MEYIAINGQFTARQVTGQERFAFELLLELDKIVKDSPLHFKLIVPKNAQNIPDLQNIIVEKYGKAKGSLWEQTYFTYYLFRYRFTSLNLCSIMPILKPGIICIHDLSYKVNPDYFKTTYTRISKIWHKLHFWLAWRFSPVIYTVSEFSKSQMIDIYHVNPKKIVVLGNGWEHFKRVNEDVMLKIRRPEIFAKPYFFSLGSLAPNKNIEWVLSVAKIHPQYNFLIAGKNGLKDYGTDYRECDLPNVRFLGYITDGEIKYLMKHCKAFIFPSFFEGFGIPPLEALSVGTKVIVARSSCLPEIFEASAYYIDPNKICMSLDELLNDSVQSGERVLQKYRFSSFARILLDSLEDLFIKKRGDLQLYMENTII
jgi:glycosyltransferase involved in cell wall biosynthesis